MDVSSRILRGVTSGAALTVVSLLVTFVQFRLILEFLPKEIAGAWFLFLTIGIYIAFFDLGVSPTLGREISFTQGTSQLPPTEQYKLAADLAATALRIFFVLALGVLLLGGVLGGFSLWSIAPVGSAQTICVAWVIFCVGASVNLLGGAPYALLYGFGYVASERMIRAAVQLVGLAASALGLYLGFGIIGLAAVWALQGLFGQLLAWKLLYHHEPMLTEVRGQASKTILKKIVSPSLKWAVTALGAILTLQTGSVVIATTLGLGSIPAYEAIVKIATALMNFSLLIAMSSAPFLSRHYAANDMVAFNVILLRGVRYGMSFTAVFVAFLAVFGDRVIEVWLGSGYFGGFPVLWTLLIMVLLEVHHVALAIGVMATGRIVFMWPAFVAGLLNVILAFILVHPLGIWGVALAIMISQLLTNNWYAPYVAFKLLNISLERYLKDVIYPIIVILIVIVVASMTMKYLTDGLLPVYSVLISLSGVAVIGVALAICHTMTGAERRVLLHRIRSMKKAA